MDKVSENPFKNRMHSERMLMIVTALFVTLYLTSNIMAVKVIGLFDWFYFDAGTITFPFAYMLGDVLTELWGFRTAKRVIWLTLVCNVLLVICTLVGVWLPSPEYLSETAMAYNHVFNYVPRIVLGSLVGFFCGEMVNAWLMEKIKHKTRGRRFVMRAVLSSSVGYLADTIPFVLIAFVGVVSLRELLLMVAFQYIMKMVIECSFGTPMAYLFVRWHKRKL